MDPANEMRGLIQRAEIADGLIRVLNHGGWGNPDVLLVEGRDGPIVVKDFSPRGGLVARWLGPFLLDREAEAYRRLSSIDAVPRFLGHIDAQALAFEYRPGVLLSRSLADSLPATFLPSLEEAVLAMHGRGVVHLDLRHRSNILADESGRPVLIDFASAMRFNPCTRWGRFCVRVLGWVDRHALGKWRARLG